MNITFKISCELLRSIRTDLMRRHPFAFERVGFISTSFSAAQDNLWILAREYRPIADQDYLDDPSVGAMMGPEAIRKALQWARADAVGLFHVHTHCGNFVPRFSRVDLREQAKFVPNFFQLVPQCPHGAIVLSDEFAYGHVWLDGAKPHEIIADFIEVGVPIKKWRTL